MKTKSILLAVFVLATISANAQKGSWYIGGNVGFSSEQDKTETGGTETKEGKSTSWTFSPEVGTFLTDHVQLGLAINFGGSKFDNQNPTPGITKRNSLGATLYSRYFFGKEAFKPFVGVNVSGASGNEKFNQGNISSEVETSAFGANINAGFGYAISKRFTTVGSFGFLGYSHNSSENVGSNVKDKTSTFGLNAGTLGNRFTVGFYYTL